MAEFHVAALMRLGIPIDQATAIVVQHHHDQLGAEPGKVVDGRRLAFYRVCGRCAEQAGLRVGPTAGDVTVLRHPDDV